MTLDDLERLKRQSCRNKQERRAIAGRTVRIEFYNRPPSRLGRGTPAPHSLPLDAFLRRLGCQPPTQIPGHAYGW